MNKLKHSIAAVVTSLVMLYSHITYAECSSTTAHISGIATIHVSEYGLNYPLQRGDFRFTNGSYNIKCSSTFGAIHFTGPKLLNKKMDTQGNDAWALEEGSSLGIAPSVSIWSTPISVYANGSVTGLETWSSTATAYLVDVVSLSALAGPSDGSTTKNYNFPDPVAYISFEAENFSVDHPAIYLDSLTVNYIHTSCGIKAKQGSTINWPGLYKEDIISGNVESKRYSLSLICGDDSAPPLPINITFSSTNGFADAANGVVRTDLNNLGLKLSWANPALPPLVLDQVNKSMLSGVGDYTVIAKPVSLEEMTNVIDSGKFDTTVTMNIEFQ